MNKNQPKYYCDLCKKEIINRKTGFLNNLIYGEGMKPDRKVCVSRFNFNSLAGLFAYKKVFIFRTRFGECYQELCDDCLRELNNTLDKLTNK